MDVKKIRCDFPILKRELHGHPLIYFDNAATSQKPKQVINAIKEFYEKAYANIHRGVHDLSQIASEKYENAHKKVAEFINAKSQKELIFVRNTTEAINLVAKTYVSNLEKGSEIVTTLMEHHSNILPWIELADRKNIKVRFVDLTENGNLDFNDLKEKISDKTKLVAVNHISNVLGTINDVKKITNLAHENNALVLVDGAQSAPHMAVDVTALDCDFFAFSSHKMLGPTGIGALYGKKEILERLPPYQSGGGAIDRVDWMSQRKTCSTTWKGLPWKFEAGTPHIAGGIGFAKAIEYLENVGIKEIHTHEKKLTRYCLARIKDEVESIEIYGPKDPQKHAGIISFNIKNSLTYHEVAGVLNEYGIAVRSGFHCAQPLHKYLGSKGSVRASFYLYNTKEEIDKFINVLKTISKM